MSCRQTLSRWPFYLLPILFYPFVQTIPLPISAVEFLSTHRAWWITTGADLSGLSSASAALSYDVPTTLFHSLWWLFLAGFSLLFRRAIRSDRGLDLFVGFLFVVAFFESFYGLLQVLVPDLGVLWHQETSSIYSGIARGTFINRNHYAAFLGMIWPVLLSYLLYLKSHSGQRSIISGQRVFLVFIIALVFLGIIFSQSRGGFIGTLIASAVLVGCGGGTRRKSLSISFACCWLIVLSYGATIGFDGIVEHFEKISDEAPGRLDLWKDSLHIIKDHPLTGVGLGNNALVYDIYQSHLPENMYASHAHNDYLELAVELGTPAALAISLLVWGYWLRTAWMLRVNLKAQDASEKRTMIRLGALAGSASFLSHSWVEFNWQIPANQVYMIALLVLMGAIATPKNRGIE
jgi:O-antigen ligase